MYLVDTHSHIQFDGYNDPEGTLLRAKDAGVGVVFVVGCTLEDSQLAVDFAATHDNVWAIVGVHPHEAENYDQNEVKEALTRLARDKKVIAIGEIGLDYFYEHSTRQKQKEILKVQLVVAKKQKLPVVFHVRNAFKDFWTLYDTVSLPGVVHSFSSGVSDLDNIVKRGLYVGLNGIMTFTKDPDQLEAAKKVPLEKLVLETDAPFLTPVPFRGAKNEPKHISTIACFLANLRGESLEELTVQTTKNVTTLFKIKDYTGN